LLLAGNYFIASLVSLYYVISGSDDYFSISTLMFGSILGGLFVLTFFAFARAVGIAGTALATVSSRLSVVVPLIMSIFIFDESPTFFQYCGFFATAITILLFYLSLRDGKAKSLNLRSYFYLLVVLIGIGINDFCMKIFQEWRPLTEKSFFLFCIFTSAFILTTSYVLITRIKPDSQVIFRGFILGVPNIFSSYFLLAALAQLAAIIVYPVINIGIILFTSIMALVLWKEKLNRYGQIALAMGVIAILLLGN